MVIIHESINQNQFVNQSVESLKKFAWKVHPPSLFEDPQRNGALNNVKKTLKNFQHRPAPRTKLAASFQLLPSTPSFGTKLSLAPNWNVWVSLHLSLHGKAARPSVFPSAALPLRRMKRALFSSGNVPCRWLKCSSKNGSAVREKSRRALCAEHEDAVHDRLHESRGIYLGWPKGDHTDDGAVTSKVHI